MGSWACNEVLTPLVVAASGIDDWTLGKFENRWSTIDTGDITVYVVEFHSNLYLKYIDFRKHFLSNRNTQ